MKIKELIEQLQSFDGELEVKINGVNYDEYGACNCHDMPEQIDSIEKKIGENFILIM